MWFVSLLNSKYDDVFGWLVKSEIRMVKSDKNNYGRVVGYLEWGKVCKKTFSGQQTLYCIDDKKDGNYQA